MEKIECRNLMDRRLADLGRTSVLESYSYVYHRLQLMSSNCDFIKDHLFHTFDFVRGEWTSLVLVDIYRSYGDIRALHLIPQTLRFRKRRSRFHPLCQEFRRPVLRVRELRM